MQLSPQEVALYASLSTQSSIISGTVQYSTYWTGDWQVVSSTHSCRRSVRNKKSWIYEYEAAVSEVQGERHKERIGYKQNHMSMWFCSVSNATDSYRSTSFTSQSYEPFCSQQKILPVSARRDQLPTRFFDKLLHPTSCLHYLIPPKGIILSRQS